MCTLANLCFDKTIIIIIIRKSLRPCSLRVLHSLNVAGLVVPSCPWNNYWTLQTAVAGRTQKRCLTVLLLLLWRCGQWLVECQAVPLQNHRSVSVEKLYPIAPYSNIFQLLKDCAGPNCWWDWESLLLLYASLNQGLSGQLIPSTASTAVQPSCSSTPTLIVHGT